MLLSGRFWLVMAMLFNSLKQEEELEEEELEELEGEELEEKELEEEELELLLFA